MTLAMYAAVLAEPVDISERGAGLGWVGGIVVTGVAIAAILLVRNMNGRIRRLPGTSTQVGADAFEGRIPPPAAPGAESAPEVGIDSGDTGQDGGTPST